ncbi:MAG: ribosomal protein S18-alanine N-acetyltransferase [Acidobacteriota bacterium]
MKEEDLPAVVEIECLSFSTPWPETSFKGELENQPVSNPYVVVSKKLDKVIGYIIFWRIGDEAQIANVAVHPDYRRKGIGKKVVEKILSLLKREEVRFVILEVRPSNTVARALYHKLGFEVIGVREGYYRDPQENALIMGKTLEGN